MPSKRRRRACSLSALLTPAPKRTQFTPLERARVKLLAHTDPCLLVAQFKPAQIACLDDWPYYGVLKAQHPEKARTFRLLAEAEGIPERRG